jgi:hypothetical protein
MALPDEKPIRSWKSIADHLGCSIRTAQRLEKERNLPVYRNAAWGVHAFESELNDWLKLLHVPETTELRRDDSESQEKASEPEPRLPQPLAATSGSSLADFLSKPGILSLLPRLRGGVLLACGLGIFLLLIAAILEPVYGLAILAFMLGAGFVSLAYGRVNDTPTARALVAAYMMAAMAYICSASTMPEFQASVVNATTLPVTATFLIVIGLKFIPLFFLVLFYWVIFGSASEVGCLGDPPKPRWYAISGSLFLSVELLLLVVTSGDDRIWSAGTPGRWPLLVSSAVVLAANLAVWLAGRHYFINESKASSRLLFGYCATAYLIVAVAAYFIDHEHNRFNKYYLDLRWPETYVVRNPDAITDLAALLGSKVRTEIGPDLASLLKDEDFKQRLRRGRFYRQHSDESFRISHPTVMFAYKAPASPNSGRAPFVSIRFPKELAEALRFEPVSDER